MKKLHELGWIHCDVKPNNILLPKNKNIFDMKTMGDELDYFLIDFGLA